LYASVTNASLSANSSPSASRSRCSIFSSALSRSSLRVAAVVSSPLMYLGCADVSQPAAGRARTHLALLRVDGLGGGLCVLRGLHGVVDLVVLEHARVDAALGVHPLPLRARRLRAQRRARRAVRARCDPRRGLVVVRPERGRRAQRRRLAHRRRGCLGFEGERELHCGAAHGASPRRRWRRTLTAGA
jgi:hypothetical protein